ncbi:hypothetical protein Q4577_05365 [Marinovum sp. 2_MG-2023]|nr:hypothetical protein [Marinovum sp. 2_MG-2023]MDO6781325.1 hypothetical protein [Marinovum sp. 1_MG-2023]
MSDEAPIKAVFLHLAPAPLFSKRGLHNPQRTGDFPMYGARQKATLKNPSKNPPLPLAPREKRD